ncbi:MAG: TonB-dependent receptor [Parvibaculales bacterium]
MTKLRKTLLGGSILSLLAFPAAAQLDEIIVTAQSRQQSLQDVPVSVVAVTGDMMIENSIGKLEDLQDSIPNFTLNETGISTNYYIRGIGSGINQAFEQSVGTYIDGVYYSRAQSSRSPFLDIERVEVLRGPQTILFGKNSIGGALNITTAKPTEELEGYFQVSQEIEDEETIVEGAVSGPISDRARVRLSARFRDTEGYYTNATLNRDEPQREDLTVRAQFEVDLADNLTANLKIEQSDFDVDGRNMEIQGETPAAAGPFTGLTYAQILVGAFGADASVANNIKDGIRSSNGDYSYNETETISLTLNWDLDGYEFKSITASTELDYDELCDCDFTGAIVFDAGLQETYEQFSQEFRLTSPADETFDYIIGAYYQDSDHNYNDQINVAANSVLVPAVNARAPGAGTLVGGTRAARTAIVDSEVMSVFGQFNYQLNEAWKVQVGTRFTREKKSGSRVMNIQALDGGALPAAQVGAPLVYANLFGITSANLTGLAAMNVPGAAAFQSSLGVIPVEGSFTEDQFSPDIKFQYEPNDDALYYVSFVQGAKAGGFDFRANNKAQYATLTESFRFDEEEADSYELGGKFRLDDGNAELNVTAYYTEFSDLQVSIFDGVLGFNVGNAAEAESTGIEIDGRWAVSENLTLTGALALTDFEFTDYKNGQCNFGETPDSTTPQGVGLCDYTGKTQPQLSDVSGFIGASYDMTVMGNYNLNINGSMSFASEYFASSTYDPALIQDDHEKFNLRLGLTPASERWEIALLGKNLTDEEILSFGGDTPLSGSSFGVKSNYAFYGQGRTITLQAGLKF